MIRQIAHCPFCHRGGIALDWDQSRIVFNPDGHAPHPCDHLAYFHGAFCVFQKWPDGTIQQMRSRCREWLWLRGACYISTGWRGHGRADLMHYLLDIALGELPHPSVGPPSPFYLRSGGNREQDHLGHELPLIIHGNNEVRGICDAWAVYAYNAGRLVEALPELLRRWDLLLRSPARE
jgi:hypothetical protein